MIIENTKKNKHTKNDLSSEVKKDGFTSEDIALLERLTASPVRGLLGQEEKTYETPPFEVAEPETPLLLTRGALNHPPTPLPHQQTHVDWVSFTSEETSQVLEEFVKIVLPKALIVPMKHGQTGYKYVKEISLHGMPIGRIGYGSAHGRNLLTLTGKGCAQLLSWDDFVHYYNVLEKPRITRIDIALDFFNGEVNHDSVIKAYEDGAFKPANAFKKPTIKTEGSVSGEGINLGRTVYIGNKKSSKFIRCYEKGLERFSKLTQDLEEEVKASYLANLANLECSEFEPTAPETSLLDWYRLEVQYGNADRELTIDVLTNRDNYFSGAYPYLEDLTKMERKTPKRIPNSLETDIEQMYIHIQNQYGSFLTTELASGKDPLAILKKCVNGKLSQRFLKAGALENIQPFDPEGLTKR